MTRHEFIGRLREALNGEIPTSAIEENVRFYNRYLDDELSKGRREEEILQELGDPRLIAKTITETWQSDDTSMDDDGQTYYSQDGYRQGSYDQGSAYGTYEEDGSRSDGFGGDSFVNINGRSVNRNKWYWKVIPVVIIFLVVAFVFWVLSGILHLTFSIVTSPIFLVILLAILVWGYFSRRR